MKQPTATPPPRQQLSSKEKKWMYTFELNWKIYFSFHTKWNIQKVNQILDFAPNIVKIKEIHALLLTNFSVQFSRSVMSDSLWPQGPQHPRPPCPSPTHGVYSNSCPSSWWCHPTISSSVVSFSSCLQSFLYPYRVGYHLKHNLHTTNAIIQKLKNSRFMIKNKI